LVREHEVDAVAHLASPLATVTERRQLSTVETVVAPIVAVLEACRLARVRRPVWASSVAGRTVMSSFLGVVAGSR